MVMSASLALHLGMVWKVMFPMHYPAATDVAASLFVQIDINLDKRQT
jgi:hypothetical protein